jgi:DNA topoisomerase-3
MTARWESTLTAITERSATYDSLMIPLIAEVTGLVENSLQVVPRGLVGIAAPKYKRRKTGRTGSSKKATGRKRKTTTSGERNTGVRKSRTAQTNRATNKPTSRRSPRKPQS